MSYVGLLAFNTCLVVSLLVAMPLDCSVQQVFLNILHLPKDTALSTDLPKVFWFIPQLICLTFFRFQRQDKSLLAHKLYYWLLLFSWCPPCFVEGGTHLGSIDNLSHASSVFSLMTHLKAEDSAQRVVLTLIEWTIKQLDLVGRFLQKWGGSQLVESWKDMLLGRKGWFVTWIWDLGPQHLSISRNMKASLSWEPTGSNGGIHVCTFHFPLAMRYRNQHRWEALGIEKQGNHT